MSLSNTTIYTFSWGDDYTKKCLRSMIIAMDKINFKEAVLITDATKTNIDNFKKEIEAYNIRVCDLELLDAVSSNMKNDDVSRGNFSRIFLEASDQFINTEYCLNVQHDSTVINSEYWTDEYFNYDYIGAPWPIRILRSSDMCTHLMTYFPNTVGNGGFSLRSKKFIQSTRGLDIFHKNEDLNICVFNYQVMLDRDVRFAPLDLALKFSVEHPIENKKTFNRDDLATYKSLGFHGEFNIAGMNYINDYKINKRCISFN